MKISEEHTHHARRIGLFLLTAYLALFAYSALTDPLVLAPQLDARENLDLAAAFDSDAPMGEPFYRAVLYPFLLSLIEPASARPVAGSLLGILLHVLNAFLVWRISKQIWNHETGSGLAAILYLLNPASLFYASLLLDITLGTTLFLAGLYTALRQPRDWRFILLAGAFMGLACLTRPHFLPLAAIFPGVVFLLRKPASPTVFLSFIPLLALLLIQGAINHRQSGDFRILPWQGAYNLWAANKPEANGLYFRQSIDMARREGNTNPAREESIRLYAQAHPQQVPPYSIDAMNAYWRNKFLERLSEDPLEIAGHWLYKGYAVLNNFEQYNNLTFSFHKERISVLRFNPLGWGLVLMAGCLGLLQLFRANPRAAAAWIVMIFSYMAMLVLFYASARFRLPLVPMLAIAAAGIIPLAAEVRSDRRLAAIAGTVVLAGALLTFSSFGGIGSKETYIQDQLLLANANADLGQDLRAARRAREVLETNPDRQEARRIYAVSYFNLALTQQPEQMLLGDWDEQKKWVTYSPPTDPVQDTVLGVYLWMWGQRQGATLLWQAIARQQPENAPLARACLIATGTSESHTPLNPLETAMQKLLLQ